MINIYSPDVFNKIKERRPFIRNYLPSKQSRTNTWFFQLHIYVRQP